MAKQLLSCILFVMLLFVAVSRFFWVHEGSFRSTSHAMMTRTIYKKSDIPKEPKKSDIPKEPIVRAPPPVPEVRERKDFFLLIMIMCHAGLRDMRDGQRRTWLRYPNVFHPRLRPKADVKYFYVVGKRNLNRQVITRLEEESAENDNDLVLLDADDSPHGRKFIQFIHWIEARGYTYEFFAKVDTDTFVRSVLLEKDLRNMSHPLYYGYGWTDRDTLCGKRNHSLFFHTGATVVLSRDILLFVAHYSRPEIEWCLHTEDVRTGLWVQEYENFTQQEVDKRITESFLDLQTPSFGIDKHPRRCVAFHLGLVKEWFNESYTYLWEHWPKDGTEEWPDTFPWVEWHRIVFRWQDEFFEKKKKRKGVDSA